MPDKFDIFNSTLDVCILSEPATCTNIIGSYDDIKICGDKEYCPYVIRCELKEAEGGKDAD